MGDMGKNKEKKKKTDLDWWVGRYWHWKIGNRLNQSISTKKQKDLAATEVKTAQRSSWTSQERQPLIALYLPIPPPADPSSLLPWGLPLWSPHSSSTTQQDQIFSARKWIILWKKRACAICLGLMIKLDFGPGWSSSISTDRSEQYYLILGLIDHFNQNAAKCMGLAEIWKDHHHHHHHHVTEIRNRDHHIAWFYKFLFSVLGVKR